MTTRAARLQSRFTCLATSTRRDSATGSLEPLRVGLRHALRRNCARANRRCARQPTSPHGNRSMNPETRDQARGRANPPRRAPDKRGHAERVSRLIRDARAWGRRNYRQGPGTARHKGVRAPMTRSDVFAGEELRFVAPSTMRRTARARASWTRGMWRAEKAMEKARALARFRLAGIGCARDTLWTQGPQPRH